MKLNILKQKLPFILLCAIAAANINISSTAKADAMINHKTTKQIDITLANTIVDKITEATKDLLNARTEKAVRIKNYINGTKPCGPLSIIVLQSVKKDWAQFLSIIETTNKYRGARLLAYVNSNLEPSMRKLGNQLIILANKIAAMGNSQFNGFVTKLRNIPVNLKRIGDKLGIMQKLKIAKCLQITTRW